MANHPAPDARTPDIEVPLRELQRHLVERLVETCAEDEPRRQQRLEELVSHFDHLVAALNANSPLLFVAHVEWARGVLEARGEHVLALQLAVRAIHDTFSASGLALGREIVERSLILAEEALSVPRHSTPTASEDVAAYLRAACEGNRNAVLESVARWALEGGAVGALVHLAAAQDAVGDAWVRNEVTVSGEHRATAMTELALAMLAPYTSAAPGPRAKGRVVVTSAPSDWHSVGPRIAADLLELAGFEVEFLGASTPGPELANLCAKIQPAVVGIGVAPLLAVGAATDAIARVRLAAPGARVIAGGWGAAIVGADVLGADEVVTSTWTGRA
jgi:MerR family transcriptional regulator, light-induced transcriptional regulator